MNSINRRELIKRLKALCFTGPYSGGRHSFMKRGPLKLRVPNPHVGDISIPLLKEILRQAGISEDEWDNAR
jgi:predicted RNA binding protein YcfA (HicA-like mRNA interferase family)